nr:hypothetical protein [Candidatus Sigynarchaeota archaeon]
MMDLDQYFKPGDKSTYFSDLIQKKIKSCHENVPLAKGFSVTGLNDLQKVFKAIWDSLEAFQAALIDHFSLTSQDVENIYKVALYTWQSGKAGKRTRAPPPQKKGQDGLITAIESLKKSPGWPGLKESLFNVDEAKNEIKFRFNLLLSYFLTLEINKAGMKAIVNAGLPLPLDCTGLLLNGTASPVAPDVISRINSTTPKQDDRVLAYLELFTLPEACQSEATLELMASDKSAQVRGLVLDLYETSPVPSIERHIESIFARDESTELRLKAFNALVFKSSDEKKVHGIIARGLNEHDTGIRQNAMKVAPAYGFSKEEINAASKRAEEKHAPAPGGPQANIDEKVTALIKTARKGKAAERDAALMEMESIMHPRILELVMELLSGDTNFKILGFLLKILYKYVGEDRAIEFVTRQYYGVIDQKHPAVRDKFGYEGRKLLNFIAVVPPDKIAAVFQTLERLIREKPDTESYIIAKVDGSDLFKTMAGRKDKPDIDAQARGYLEATKASNVPTLNSLIKTRLHLVDAADASMVDTRLQELKALDQKRVKATILRPGKLEKPNAFLAGQFIDRAFPLPIDRIYNEKLDEVLDFVVPFVSKGSQSRIILDVLASTLQYYINPMTRVRIWTLLVTMAPDTYGARVKADIEKTALYFVSGKKEVEGFYECLHVMEMAKIMTGEEIRDAICKLFYRFDERASVYADVLRVVLSRSEQHLDEIKGCLLHAYAELSSMEHLAREKFGLNCFSNEIQQDLFEIGIPCRHSDDFTADQPPQRENVHDKIVEPIARDPALFDHYVLMAIFSKPYWTWCTHQGMGYVEDEAIPASTATPNMVQVVPPLAMYYIEHLRYFLDHGLLRDDQVKALRDMARGVLANDNSLLNALRERGKSSPYIRSKLVRDCLATAPQPLPPLVLIKLIDLTLKIDKEIVMDQAKVLMNSPFSRVRQYMQEFAAANHVEMNDPATELTNLLKNVIVEEKVDMWFEPVKVAQEKKLGSWHEQIVGIFTKPGFDLMAYYTSIPDELKIALVKTIARQDIDTKAMLGFMVNAFTTSRGAVAVKQAVFRSLAKLAKTKGVAQASKILLDDLCSLDEKIGMVEQVMGDNPAVAAVLTKDLMAWHESKNSATKALKTLYFTALSNKKSTISLGVHDLEAFLPATTPEKQKFIGVQLAKIDASELKDSGELKRYAEVAGQFLETADRVPVGLLGNFRSMDLFTTLLDRVQPRFVKMEHDFTSWRKNDYRFGDLNPEACFARSFITELDAVRGSDMIPAFLQRFGSPLLYYVGRSDYQPEEGHFVDITRLISRLPNSDLARQFQLTLVAMLRGLVGRAASDRKQRDYLYQDIVLAMEIPKPVDELKAFLTKEYPPMEWLSVVARWGSKRWRDMISWGCLDELKAFVVKEMEGAIEDFTRFPDTSFPEYHAIIEWSADLALAIREKAKDDAEIVRVLMRLKDLKRKKHRSSAIAALKKLGYYSEPDGEKE